MDPDLRTPLIVGVGLAVFQQITGINTVIYYAPTIFQYAGYSSAAVALLATVGVGIANVVFTCVAILLLDRVGRRPLLLVGIFGMVVTLALLGVDFLLPVADRGRIAIACLMGFVACFAISLGPIFWLMIAEIYPLKVRGRAMSIATLSNWLANLLVTFTFPLMITTIGTIISFWVNASMGMANLIFAFFLVPETKGYTLEEIEAWWRKKQTNREWNEACGS